MGVYLCRSLPCHVKSSATKVIGMSPRNPRRNLSGQNRRPTRPKRTAAVQKAEFIAIFTTSIIRTRETDSADPICETELPQTQRTHQLITLVFAGNKDHCAAFGFIGKPPSGSFGGIRRKLWKPHLRLFDNLAMDGFYAASPSFTRKVSWYGRSIT
jgi:hypothetical protein